MKSFILLFLPALVFFGSNGTAWAYGVPAISPADDPDLLTQTPIPLLTFTPTPTVTATATATFTMTLTPTSTPTATGIGIPTLVETVTLPSQRNANGEKMIPNHEMGLDPVMQGLSSFKEHGFFEIGLGIDPQIANWSSAATNGTGAKGAIGLSFKDGFSIQLELEYFSHSLSEDTGTLVESEVLVLPTLRRYLTAGNVRPYLSLSDGLAVETSTMGLSNSTTNSFDLALGCGFEFLFENYFSTYVEGKYNFVFQTASPSQDIPVVVGARLGL